MIVRRKDRLWAAAAVVLFSLAAAAGAAESVFALEEVSIGDCPEPALSQLQLGQYASESSQTPMDGVVYPTFKSSRPIYGAVTFDMDLLDPASGRRYCFAVDESDGTDKGYDRLYFDVNHDSDLTNDSPLARVKDTPAGMSTKFNSTFFERMQLDFDYGSEGVWKQTIQPHMLRIGSTGMVFFAVPTARKGKIRLGSEEVEIILAQNTAISGRYDRPMTSVFVIGKNEMFPFVACLQNVNGTFYRLIPTPAGDKVRVEPYSGAFGVFEIGKGSRDIATPVVDLGWLQSKDTIIDLTACTEKDGKWNVPVGDYRPYRMAIRYGTRRIGLSADASTISRKDAQPAVFPLTIRPEKPFVLDFPGKPDVVFRSPTPDRVKVGELLRAVAVLYLPGTNIMISAIDDTTRKKGTAKLADGRESDTFEPVPPTIKIANSSGQIMAEGDMPFG